MNSNYAEKAEALRRLHQEPGTFVIPNPWDVGSARMLELMGFKALATSSAGFAFSRGKADMQAGRTAVLVHIADVHQSTGIPLSADLENGFGDAPDTVAETIRMAAAAGAAGGSIEDATGNADAPQYDLAFAKERIQAAVQAARALPLPFTLTARAENFFVGVPDLKDTISRLQAYQEAGADVLFAPGLKTVQDIATVVREVDRPLNVVMGLAGTGITVAQLAELGVKRISVGSSLARAAYGAFIRAAEEIRDQGTFDYADQAVPMAKINAMLKR